MASAISDEVDTYATCHGPLIEIDHYSERLPMELPEEDLEAWRARVRPT